MSASMSWVRSVGRVVICVVVAAITVSPAWAGAVFVLDDHPDGGKAPPPYGLRLDKIFSATPASGSVSPGGVDVNKVTTFSFGHPGAKVLLKVDDSSPTLKINISGTVYGGIDVGSSYGFGEGFYDLNFDYLYNVVAQGTGWAVAPVTADNKGSITAQAGITGVQPGTTWNFYEKAPANNNFKFLQDQHRLLIATGGDEDFPIAALMPHVGRGWVTFNSDGSDYSGTHDFIFTGQIVPLPAAGWLCVVMLGSLGGVKGLRRIRGR